MIKKIAIVAVFVSFIALSPFYPAHAGIFSSKDDSNLKEEINSLRKEIQELKKEVEGLKAKVVSAKPAQPQDMPPEAQEVSISTDNGPVMGNNNAPVTIIEFSDYQCPFCKRFVQDIFPDLQRDYINTGKVKYIFRDFPLDFHSNARKAAEAAHCAGDQGKYWDMHDKIFINQPNIQAENLKRYAAELGLKTDLFNSCLDSGKYSGEVNKNLDDARRVDVSGTPTFFIGKSPANGKEMTAKKILGARPYSSFKPMIDDLLESK